ARLLVQRLARVDVHVDPDEIDELARPHRPAGAELHPGVEILDRDTCLIEDADAIVQQGDQHTVDDEPRRVVAANRLSAEPLDDRLDHEVAVDEIADVGRQRQPRDGIVPRRLVELAFLDLAREEVRDPRLRLLTELERHLAPDRVDACLDAKLGDAGAHRTESDDADPHARESMRGPSVAIKPPAAPISEGAAVRPMPRARYPIAGPL